MRMSECDDRYICVREVELDGEPTLELGVYARIGAYHIYQCWYLQSKGEVGDILPTVFSKGLSCNLKHWHHPHWRFDFELDGTERHRVHFLNGGNRVAIVPNEASFQNGPPADNPGWLVENIDTHSSVTITPPELNEPEGIVGPDTFSPIDVYIRKYRPEEDEEWPFHEQTEMNFALHEPVDGQNVVFWNISHLQHIASEGANHWHQVTSGLRFWPAPVDTQPHQRRRVRVSGTMHLKNFKATSKDNWSHPTFDDNVIVEPGHPHREIRVENSVGDIRAELLLILDWQADNSVQVVVWARLYDEGDDVARTNGQVHVLRESFDDASVHLRDWHVTDPDTTDIDFRIENMQA